MATHADVPNQVIAPTSVTSVSAVTFKPQRYLNDISFADPLHSIFSVFNPINILLGVLCSDTVN